MERGVRRQSIFEDEMDYQIFLAILKRATEKYEAKVHAYCLMTNHIHLLLETGECEIGIIMQKIAGDYARTYNKKYGYRGHVFEDRYKSIIVKDDWYFLQTSRYIHLNPVRAKMVSCAEEYKWSSYRTVLGMVDDGITVKDQTLGYFMGKSVQKYQKFVENIS